DASNAQKQHDVNFLL
nr:RecName: Full=Lectin 80 kDa subunit; AltName: Full=LsL [Penaeus setiferus]